MSGLVKADALEMRRILPFAVEDPVRDARIAQLADLVATLEADAVKRDQAMHSLTAAGERAYAEGLAAGRRQADEGAASRLSLLEHAIAASQDRLGEVLAGTERLAALLARECLATLFVETDDRAALVTDLIRRQMVALGEAAILTIEVSADDFPKDELAKLEDRVAPVAIRPIDALPTGSCGFVLRLGRIEIGIEQQWGALGDLLNEFTDAGVMS